MKTNILCTFSLAMLILAACSKKSPVNNDTDVKFPNNIASTWSKTIISLPTDTFTVSGSDGKWVKDKIILTSTEAAKLQAMIMAVPEPIRDDFATKFKKVMVMLQSPEIILHSNPKYAKETQEYKDFDNFCTSNEKNVLPLAMGSLFNDTDELISSTMATWCMESVLKGRFEDLRKEVNDERLAHPTTPDGKHIISYTTKSLQRRLAKKILNQP